MVVWGLGAFLSAGAWGIVSLLIFRVIVGIGVGGEAPVAQAILSEFIPAERRGKYIALMEGFWSVGYVLSGAISFALIPILPADGFRVVFAVTGVLAVVIFLARRWLPESPRWFAEQGRYERADRELALIEAEVARRYGDALPPVREREGVLPVRGNPVAILWSRRYLKRTLMAGGLWFFALLGYFGLTTWLTTLLHAEGFSVAKSLGFTTLISLGGFPGFLVAAYLIERLGRKPTMAIFLVGSAGMAYLYGHPFSGLLFVEGFLMQFFFFGMWCVLYAYTPELYPTNARASGAGWASAFGRVGAILGPTVVGAVLSAVGTGGVFTIGAASFVLATVLVLVLGPETRGRVLEEISETVVKEGG
jgi:putative MFS transporter